MTIEGFVSRNHVKKLIKGYAQVVRRRVRDDGWNPYLVTFNFKPLRGKRGHIIEEMLDEIDRIYSTFITRVVRDPRREAVFNKVLQFWGLDYPEDKRPIFITSIDGFCWKRQKVRIRGSQLNHGIHAHGILVVPWESQLKQPVPEHSPDVAPLN